jgi:hypothetical protein
MKPRPLGGLIFSLPKPLPSPVSRYQRSGATVKLRNAGNGLHMTIGDPPLLRKLKRTLILRTWDRTPRPTLASFGVGPRRTDESRDPRLTCGFKTPERVAPETWPMCPPVSFFCCFFSHFDRVFGLSPGARRRAYVFIFHVHSSAGGKV